MATAVSLPDGGAHGELVRPRRLPIKQLRSALSGEQPVFSAWHSALGRIVWSP